jgi:hypothetical protein
VNALPPDVGDGVVCASFAADGSWLSVGTTDPELGFVELSGMPPFPDSSRGDVAAVRAYRLLMEDVASAFLRVEGASPTHRAASGGSVTQTYTMAGSGPVIVEFAGRLDRPACVAVATDRRRTSRRGRGPPAAGGHERRRRRRCRCRSRGGWRGCGIVDGDGAARGDLAVGR